MKTKVERERPIQINFRVNEKEYKRILNKASSSHSLSAYLRNISQKGKVYIPSPSIDRTTSIELNRIGVNINQIAHKLNEWTGNIYNRKLLKELRSQINHLEPILEDRIINLYEKTYNIK